MAAGSPADASGYGHPDLAGRGSQRDRGRVHPGPGKFGVLRPNRRQAAASHPSALIGWNTALGPCAHLGLLLPLGGAVA